MLAYSEHRRTLRLTTVALAAPVILAVAPSPLAHAANCAPGDPAGGEFTAVLRSSRGLIVSAEVEYDGATEGMLRARATRVGQWERFRIRCLGNARVALRAANGRWVSAELGAGYTDGDDGMLRARSTSVGLWETFAYHPVDGASFGDGPMALESVANARLVAAEFDYQGSRQGMLRARSTERLDWETFTANVISPVPVPPPTPQPPAPGPAPAPAPSRPPASVQIPRGCVAAGKGVVVRVRAFRKRGRRPRIRAVRFTVRPSRERVVDRRAPFRVRLGERLAPGTVARVRARVTYRWPGARRTRSRVLRGRIRVCP
jgi:hypothetical protein